MSGRDFIKIGKKIKAKRKKLAYSVKELAQVCGISENAIYQCESGRVESRPQTLKRIYAALDLEPEQMEGEPKPEMTEKQLEQKFVDAVKGAGGIAYKFTSPGHNGVPDRLVILPVARTSNGKALSHYGFVEVKKPGAGKISPMQNIELKRLTGYGANCYVLDDPNKISVIIKDIETGWYPKIRFNKGVA